MGVTLLGAEAKVQVTIRLRLGVGAIMGPWSYATLVRYRIESDLLLWEEGSAYCNLLKLCQLRDLRNHDGLWVAITDGVGVDQWAEIRCSQCIHSFVSFITYLSCRPF